MRQDVKELADAMERGWKLVPRNCLWFFNDDYGIFKIKPEKVESACAMGHAMLGIGDTVVSNLNKNFPVLTYQKIEHPMSEHPMNKGATLTLEYVITELLVEHKWKTPKVVKWLRSHQND